MSPEDIEQHGHNVRRKLKRIFDNSSYKNFGPVKEIFAAADDLCEIVILLAENQKATAAPAPTITIQVEQPNPIGLNPLLGAALAPPEEPTQ